MEGFQRNMRKKNFLTIYLQKKLFSTKYTQNLSQVWHSCNNSMEKEGKTATRKYDGSSSEETFWSTHSNNGHKSSMQDINT